MRAAAKERGFRSEQAFILTACENEVRRGDETEATTHLEDCIAATLANVTKEVQALFTLVHVQLALTNSLLQYVLTCMVEPPEEVLPAARARARLRYAKILRLVDGTHYEYDPDLKTTVEVTSLGERFPVALVAGKLQRQSEKALVKRTTR